MPKRCALGCSNKNSYHQFPHPEKNPDCFKAWVHIAGGKLDGPADYELYRKKVICEIHFTDKDRNRNNRLNFLAVPSLHLPGNVTPYVQREIATPNDLTQVSPQSFTSEPSPSVIVETEKSTHKNVAQSSAPQSCTTERPKYSMSVLKEHNYTGYTRRKHMYGQKDNLKNWASQPDVCRCCLSTSGSWHLLAVYDKEGEKHVYSDVLHSCFGISLSSVTEVGPRQLICDQCVNRLLDANTFKKQVVQAEQEFVSYMSKQVTSKEMFEVEGACSPEIKTDPLGSDIAEPSYGNSSDDILLSMPGGISIKPETNINKDTALDNQDREDSGDSDIFEELLEISDAIYKVTPDPIKQISERKRLKITCDSILRFTTACPFRHYKSWFQCFFCTQSFMDISTLRTHTHQAHSNLDTEIKNLKRYPRSLQIDITKFECRSCNLNINNVESMQSHLNDSHKVMIFKECIADYKINSSPYSCHICGKEFHVFRTLTTHLNEHNAYFICDICGKSFINSKRLNVHSRTHETGNFPCSLCGRVLKTKTAKANHMEKHSKRVLKCQICQKPMKHYNARVKHMSDEHNITHRFQCHICGREYNIRHYLSTHIRQTHGQKNKKCVDCGMAFITNHDLKKHMQRHTGFKAYSCGTCSKSYARSYSLRKHMKTHET